MGFYLYAVVVAESARVEPPLLVLEDGGFGCVVRESKNAEGTPGHRAAGTAAHEAVLAQLLRSGPLLPIRPGTVLPDEVAVRAALRTGAAQFAHAFQETQGRLEYQTVVRWDLQRQLRLVARERAIAGQRDSLMQSRGDELLMERLLLGKLVREAIERRRLLLQNAVISRLRPGAYRTAVLRVEREEDAAHLALLLEEHQREEVQQRLDALRRRRPEIVDVSLEGPLPPGSFAGVEVRRMDFAEIDGSRRLLGLPARVRWHAVCAAHRRALDSDSPRAAAAASDAFTTLADYFLSLGAGDGRTLSLDWDDVCPTLLVRVGPPRASSSNDLAEETARRPLAQARA